MNISRAKESFLDRLKREREESTQVDQGDSSYNHNSYNKNDYQQETYKPLPTIEKEILSGGESSEDEDDQGEATEVSARQLQVIKAAKTFRLDDDGKTVLTKAELDDKKRQESLKKLKDRHMEQKIAIRNALSASAGPRNNKIVFEPPEPMEVEQEPASKAQLFDEEDDEVDTGNFTVKKQFAGKNGARMLELQSQFGDNRFKIDERFVDDSDGLIDARKKYTREELKERKKLRKEMLNWDQDEMKEERDHQLSILESITGQSTGFVKSQHKPNLDHKEMLRFDPSKKDHKKYLDIVRGDEDVDDDEDPKDKKTDENFQVSSERFYEVSDNLASALQTSSKPFSIFEMLGVSHNDPDEVAVDKNPAKEEEIEPKLLSKLPMFQLNQMKFQYDSSDTDEEEEKRKQMNQKKKVHKDKQNQSKGGKYSKSGVFRFNLFYTDDDPRLKGDIDHLFFHDSKYAIFNFKIFHFHRRSQLSQSHHCRCVDERIVREDPKKSETSDQDQSQKSQTRSEEKREKFQETKSLKGLRVVANLRIKLL